MELCVAHYSSPGWCVVFEDLKVMTRLVIRVTRDILVGKKLASPQTADLLDCTFFSPHIASTDSLTKCVIDFREK